MVELEKGVDTIEDQFEKFQKVLSSDRFYWIRYDWKIKDSS